MPSNSHVIYSLLLVITNSLIIPSLHTASAQQKLIDKAVLQDLNESNQLYVDEQQKRQQALSKIATLAEKFGYQHGYMTEMQYFHDQMMRRKSHWDNQLDFGRLSSLLSDGAVEGMYLIGGIVDEVDSSIRTIDDNLLIIEDTKYEIRTYPRLSISPPNWIDYLFPEEHVDLSLPSRSILPKNDQERIIWRKGIEKGWKRGVEVAREEYRKRYSELFADLIGMTNYWYLVETGIIRNVTVDTKNYYLEHRKLDSGGETLTFNPTTVNISNQATFNTSMDTWSTSTTLPNQNTTRTDLRDSIVLGEALLEEATNNDVTIMTSDHQQLMESLQNEQFERLSSNP